MRSTRRYILQAVIVLCFSSSSAWAQASHVWVSGAGDDTQPCSRTAPCKTFAGAVSKVADGGEINALDAGDYGPVTIGKSVTIDGGGTLASIVVTSPIGVIINASTSATVTLRNLSIDGAGIGMEGIRVYSAGRVILENLLVTNFVVDPGIAIEIGTGSPVSVAVRNCSITNTRRSAISCSGGGSGTRLSIEHSRIAYNNSAIEATAGTTLTIIDSSIAQNTLALALDSTSSAHLQHCSVSQNRFGFSVGGPLVLSACQITGNEFVFSPVGHVDVRSHGNNAITGNGDLGMTPVQIGLQ